MMVVIATGLLILTLVSFGAFWLVRKRHLKKLRHTYYLKCWKEIQSECKNKSGWPVALNNADKLLDKALRKKGYKGKTMGERMVSAQRNITDNDGLWFAHNLSKKVRSGEQIGLKEKNIKSALIGFRQALRDIGALPRDKRDE